MITGSTSESQKLIEGKGGLSYWTAWLDRCITVQRARTKSDSCGAPDFDCWLQARLLLIGVFIKAEFIPKDGVTDETKGDIGRELACCFEQSTISAEEEENAEPDIVDMADAGAPCMPIFYANGAD